eukprot:1750798-Prymnesium_polylepis.1
MHGKLAYMYGADATMEEVRTAKKAGIMTRTRVIEAKDTSALVAHFMSLAREYATRQMPSGGSCQRIGLPKPRK